jgi:hypothetical protein
MHTGATWLNLTLVNRGAFLMLDVAFLAIGVAFFALSIGYVLLCDRL